MRVFSLSLNLLLTSREMWFFRSKGVLVVRGISGGEADLDGKVVYQVAMHTQDEEVIGPCEEGQKRYCKAVFFRLGLNRWALAKQSKTMILVSRDRGPLSEFQAARGPLPIGPLDVMSVGQWQFQTSGAFQ
eukprot:gnl/MRDRNA2_/MRDRNA2_256194_c0_seq1.p1 gnl/MRDRNA2_/MRDRNA2_256194_c0~~gnl/MRDRNA2_/MRDRNA2_256194_c0_seq1.p1  ORF type:complete len:131 (-),score=18.83 gnl/MRDRNA2_/MRDRNA2_256194_c0_seq1:192-584(-)